MSEHSEVMDLLNKIYAAVKDGSPSTSEPTTPPPNVPVTGKHPTDVLPELKRWTIMRPTGQQGKPDNGFLIGQSIKDVFFVQSDGGVVFQANAGGNHSPNSKYARSEARQMIAEGKWDKAAWSSSGSHTLDAELSIDTSQLVARKRINGIQIHDGGDDVCQIMKHESQGLGFMHQDGKEFLPIDPSYKDGTRFRCRIEAVQDRIKVFYNGQQKIDVEKKGSGWYWKIGCYLQTDVPNWKESPNATGKVTVYSLSTTGGGQ